MTSYSSTGETYEIPDLCARCGTQPPKQLLPLSQVAERKTSFLSRRTTVRRIVILVPLCSSCDIILVRQKNLLRLVNLAVTLTILGCLIGILFVLSLPLISSMKKEPDIQLLTVLIVLMIASTFLNQYILPRFEPLGIFKYTDIYFEFKNPRFQQAFFKLNPDLVKQYHRRRDKDYEDF